MVEACRRVFRNWRAGGYEYASATLWSALSTAMRVGSGFVVNKVAAVASGPAGVAMLGQFQNFMTIVQAFGTGSIQQGLVKYTAEHGATPAVRARYISAAVGIAAFCSLLTAVVLCLSYRIIATRLIGEREAGLAVLAAGVATPFLVFNLILLGILNGLGRVAQYVKISCVQAALSVGLLFALTPHFHLTGVMISLPLGQALGLGVAIWWVAPRAGQFPWREMTAGFSRKEVADYARFALMAVVASLVAAWSQIQIRGLITAYVSPLEAGLWQGMNRISTAYMATLSTTLSIHYLPRLAAATTAQRARSELQSGLKTILFILIPLMTAVYLCRDVIVLVLFTPEFKAMRDLFAWQLGADLLKAVAWHFAYILWARGMAKYFIWSEILNAIVYAVAAFWAVQTGGMIAVFKVYVLVCLLYLGFATWVFRKSTTAMEPTRAA